MYQSASEVPIVPRTALVGTAPPVNIWVERGGFRARRAVHRTFRPWSTICVVSHHVIHLDVVEEIGYEVGIQAAQVTRRRRKDAEEEEAASLLMSGPFSNARRQVLYESCDHRGRGPKESPIRPGYAVGLRRSARRLTGRGGAPYTGWRAIRQPHG